MTLKDWGWDDSWVKQAAQAGFDIAKAARVVGQDRGTWSLQTDSGPEIARVPSASGLDPSPVVGDWVEAEPGPMPTDSWTILAVFPRRTQISRGAAGTTGEEQVLAANVDEVWIVQGLDMPFNSGRLERYLTVVQDSGATPVIVLTKSDLPAAIGPTLSQVQSVAMDVPVKVVSSKNHESIQELYRSLAPGRTVSLFGPSGVGKSTLVNLLAREAIASTGATRKSDGKGRHTTTRREIFLIQGGALLLDTPGIRELRVWARGEGLGQTFPDIEALALDCRFRDCRHQGEPGCAIRKAITAKTLDPVRLASFRKLQTESAQDLSKTDSFARSAGMAERKSDVKASTSHTKKRKRK